jgi:hypothetical protein
MNLAQILDGEKNQLVVKGILGGEEINWWSKGNSDREETSKEMNKQWHRNYLNTME